MDDGDYGTRERQLEELHSESDEDDDDDDGLSSMKSGQFKALNSSLKVQ